MPPLPPPEFLPLPPPLPVPKFTLGPVSLSVLGSCAALHLLLSIPALRAGDAHLAGQNFGVFMMGFLLSVGLAWLAWRWGGRRGGGFVFCALMALFGLGRLNESFQASRVKTQAVSRDLERMKNLQREALREQEKSLAETGSISAGSQRIDQSVKLMRESAGNLSGDDRKAMEAVARVMANFQAKARTFEAATQAMEAAGFSSVVGLDSREAIARRRALAKVYAEANTDLTEASRGMEAALRAEVGAVVNRVTADTVTRQAMVGFDTAKILRVRDSERRAVEAMDGLLALYEEEFPRWHLEENKRLIFENAAAVPRHQRWMQLLTDAGKEQTALQREFVEQAKARLNRPPATGR